MIKLRTFAKILAKRPRTVLLVYTIITVLIGLQASNLYMQSELSGFLPKDDPTLELLNEISNEFKIGSTIIILLNQTNKPDVRDYRVLQVMDDIYYSLYEKPAMAGKETGIANFRSLAVLIRQENTKPYPMGNGRDEIPNDADTISKYMDGTLISSMEGILYTRKDQSTAFNYAVIIIQLKENANYYDILENTKIVVEDMGTRYSHMSVTGSIAVQYAIQKQNLQSLKIVLPLAALFVAIILIFFHRTLKGLLIGFMPLGYAVILTFGLLGIVQPEMTILSIAAVALLLGLGVDYSIYLANRYAEEHDIEDKVERVERTLGRTGKAVLMCAITTIVGFGSLMTSNMPPMVTFGLACTIGISFAFISAAILVPCLCIILKFEKHETAHRWKRFSNFVVDQRKRLFPIACFFVLMSLLLIPLVKTDVNFLEMAPDGIPEVESLFEYSNVFGSGTNFNALLVETDAGGLKDPDVIEALYKMENEIRSKGVSAISIADEIKEINDRLGDIAKIDTSELNYDDFINASYEIDAKNIRYGVYSLSIGDELERNETWKQTTTKEKIIASIQDIIYDKVAENGLITKDFSKTIIVIYFPAEKSVQEMEVLVNDVNAIVSKTNIANNGHVSRLVGQDVITVEVNKQIMGSQASSMVIALLLVLSCLIVGFNSIKIGSLALIPVLFVLAWEPGALVSLNIPLSVLNMTVASIMIGTGIDYSVQITQRVKEERENGLSKIDAVRTAIETSGLSLVGAAVTTIFALLATYFAFTPMLFQFGTVVILLIGFSFLATMFVLPIIFCSRFVK
jgi:predicted RND superfamily exporter protein